MSAEDRRDQIVRTTAELLAAGIDPKKSTLYVQSHVMGASDLAWMFNCVTPIAELDRMTQFKDKSQSQSKNINAGLYTYPVLQAADILLYKGEIVPVGEDQVQHVELTRDIAKWFNKKYKTDVFPKTKALLTKTARVKSLLEPTSKMSKSKGSGHVIELADEPEIIAKKIKKAVTATEGGGDNPGVYNLLLLLKEFGSADAAKAYETAEKDGSIRYGDLKNDVATAVSDYFADFRAKRNELMEDHNEILDVLAHGAERAQTIADATMKEVRTTIGIR